MFPSAHSGVCLTSKSKLTNLIKECNGNTRQKNESSDYTVAHFLGD